MCTTHELVTREAVAQSEGLNSRISRDRIASLQRIIAVGLEAGVSIDDIRDRIARQRGALLAGSQERAPIAWSDATERDFFAAFEAVCKAAPAANRRALVGPVEDWV